MIRLFRSISIISTIFFAMKKVLLFSFVFLFISSLKAQIQYTDYGDGWVIPMHANEAVDVNNDGNVDFYVNGLNGELGVIPITLIGCFSSPSYDAVNNLGSRELSILEEGEMIQIDDFSMFDYIDDDRGTLFDADLGLADGWTDMEDEYIGFAVFIPGLSYVAINGWMKVAIDVTNETFIIKEMAYGEPSEMGAGGIKAGDTGQTVAVQTVDQLNELTIAPNPATDFVQLAFDYTGGQNLSVIIQNAIGKEIYRNNRATFGQTNLNIPTTDWTAGMYIIRFETQDGIRTEKLSITR